jgi:hypothetical protein
MYLAAVVPPEEEPMKRIQHTLTSDELLHLYASPVQLLPPPGPDKYYVIFALFAHYFFNTTPYNLNGTLAINLKEADFIPSYVDAPALLDQTHDTLTGQGPAPNRTPAAGAFNAPLVATAGYTSELTEGDGTLLLILYYTIESTT